MLPAKNSEPGAAGQWMMTKASNIFTASQLGKAHDHHSKTPFGDKEGLHRLFMFTNIVRFNSKCFANPVHKSRTPCLWPRSGVGKLPTHDPIPVKRQNKS